MAVAALSPENSLDQFIRDTKLKLRHEREGLAGQDRGGRTSGRKQWNKQEPAENTRFAQQQSTGKPPAGPGYQQPQAYRKRDVSPQEEERNYEKFQKQEEARKSYDESLAQKQQMLKDHFQQEVEEGRRIVEHTSSQQLPTYGDQKQRLREERHKEMQEFLSQQGPQRQNFPSPEHTGLLFGDNSEKQKQLQEERKREYNEMMANKKVHEEERRRRVVPEGNGATLPVGGEYEKRKQQLEEERHRDFLEQQQKLQQRNEQQVTSLPPKPQTPNAFFKGLGEHDRKVQQLKEERKKEYNQMIAEKNFRSRDVNPESEQYIATLPINEKNSAQLRKIKERNEEYNEFLRQKQDKDRRRFDSKKPTTAPDPRHGNPSERAPLLQAEEQLNQREGTYATLPGMSKHDSAEKRKIMERNREYNQFLKQKEVARGPRKGWSTPTNDDLRVDEAQRRQYDDPQVQGRMKSYASDGALNRQGDYRQNEPERGPRKSRFQSDQARGILEDDNWLDQDRQRKSREQEYQELKPLERKPPPPTEMATRVQPQGYFATLPLGQDDRESAKRRKKEEYKRELQLQMEEAAAARKREKVQQLRVNASGLLDPEKNISRVAGLGDPDLSPRREYKSRDVQPYHTKILLDGVAPESQAAPGQDRRSRIDEGRRRDARNGGILDTGFADILSGGRRGLSSQPPPGLMYQPSTYVTGGGGSGGLGQPYSSIDEAYHYYGMKNPLDPEGNGGGGGGGLIPSLDLDRGDGRGARTSPPPRVTFADEIPSTRRDRSKSRERITPYQFSSDEEHKMTSRQTQQSYQQELERQIAERKYRKAMEKADQERYEKKMEEEAKNYNPFGKAGGGAPNRDQFGNPMADLRHMHRENENPNSVPVRQYSPPPSNRTPTSNRPPSPRDDKIKPAPNQYNALGEKTFARGGHGIFGQPKTDAEKDASDKYKEDLRIQIEEKRRQAQMEKELERIEEEKENRRLEEQRKRIEAEVEEEKRRKKERDDEARRKNEELQKQAEDRKREQERKKKELEEERLREKQEQTQERRPQQPEERRVSSPPLPAQRTQDNLENQSPPQRIERPPSSDVLTQLAAMRKQLQSERRRVENALESSRNEPDVFDPRTIQRPPPNPGAFDKAMNKISVIPPRATTSDNANQRNVQDFNELKFKDDGNSRRAFRSMFPENPVTNSALEMQQDAMLRQQEAQLQTLKDKGRYDVGGRYQGQQTSRQSARSQLEASSAFIDVDGVNHFPEDFEDIPRRNDSARNRRRDRIPITPRPGSYPNQMGSQASLDVDRIQYKNEDRLRRLQNIGGDDVSLQDPDDILDRFMAKQRYNRPPSGQTLQDDTWLRPGSKVF
ncbi:hypothetical protein CHS0354_010764 [Potamilus streckersoni]|uniref:Centrosome and spindle pole-associated protein 1 C-terminal domain-containing protein n=1 Tax=Potamilus streckersoni TaxID=2493646 RepID=A0AAE0WAE0_9BIVA|nr:hypothetical protein CHS0354_010764 [Potamilus streckersoni]